MNNIPQVDQQKLFQTLNFLISTTEDELLLKEILKRVLKFDHEDDKLIIGFAEDRFLILEAPELKKDYSHLPKEAQSLFQRYSRISFPDDDGWGLILACEKIDLETNQVANPESVFSVWSDWWIYKGKTLSFVSHETGKIEKTTSENLGSLYLKELGVSLEVDSNARKPVSNSVSHNHFSIKALGKNKFIRGNELIALSNKLFARLEVEHLSDGIATTLDFYEIVDDLSSLQKRAQVLIPGGDKVEKMSLVGFDNSLLLETKNRNKSTFFQFDLSDLISIKLKKSWQEDEVLTWLIHEKNILICYYDQSPHIKKNITNGLSFRPFSDLTQSFLIEQSKPGYPYPSSCLEVGKKTIFWGNGLLKIVSWDSSKSTYIAEETIQFKSADGEAFNQSAFMPGSQHVIISSDSHAASVYQLKENLQKVADFFPGLSAISCQSDGGVLWLLFQDQQGGKSFGALDFTQAQIQQKGPILIPIQNATGIIVKGHMLGVTTLFPEIRRYEIEGI